MAEKQKFFDLWILDTNTVYKQVPYAVVTDWLQQGRLLEEDKAKPTGAKDWLRLGDVSELRAFVPQPEPFRADDQAEALEGVHLDFGYKKGHGDEDDEVDMIPLIDVSLVLLVFFMLSASSAEAGSATKVQTPATSHGEMLDNPGMLRLDIELDNDRNPVYSMGIGSQKPEEGEGDLATQEMLLDRLRNRLLKTPGTLKVLINADKKLPAKETRRLLLALRREQLFRDKITEAAYGVSDRGE